MIWREREGERRERGREGRGGREGRKGGERREGKGRGGEGRGGGMKGGRGGEGRREGRGGREGEGRKKQHKVPKSFHVLAVRGKALQRAGQLLGSPEQEGVVGEGVQHFHGQRPLPERLVTVQEPYQHGQEDLALGDL